MAKNIIPIVCLVCTLATPAVSAPFGYGVFFGAFAFLSWLLVN